MILYDTMNISRLQNSVKAWFQILTRMMEHVFTWVALKTREAGSYLFEPGFKIILNFLKSLPKEGEMLSRERLYWSHHFADRYSSTLTTQPPPKSGLIYTALLLLFSFTVKSVIIKFCSPVMLYNHFSKKV